MRKILPYAVSDVGFALIVIAFYALAPIVLFAKTFGG